jgi:ribonuclease HII
MARFAGRSSTTSATSPEKPPASASGVPLDHKRLPLPPETEARGRVHARRLPDLRIEQVLWDGGKRRLAGVDEAGRGAWAGPVVAASVILPPDPDLLCSLREPWTDPESGAAVPPVQDSKQLTPIQRTRIAERVRDVVLAVGVGIVPCEIIDELGIAFAGQLAFWRAVRALPIEPDYLLVDGFPLWSDELPQLAVLQGDARSLSIAAASVVAKVARDELMARLHLEYPEYGFDHNCGYGTRSHQSALRNVGPSPLHRRSYAPIASLALNGQTMESMESMESDA